jgi:hypothetical protein
MEAIPDREQISFHSLTGEDSVSDPALGLGGTA